MRFAESAPVWLVADAAEFATALAHQLEAAGGQVRQFGWHDAPRRQYVVTLTGELEFSTHDGTVFRIGPGDVLLAEDTTGGGHSWRTLGDDPWRRVYVALD